MKPRRYSKRRSTLPQRTAITGACLARSMGVEVTPSGDGNNGAFYLAVALAQAGHLDRYREECHRFLERCSDPEDHFGQYRAAEASLMLPVKGADLDRACQFADSG